MQFLRRLLEYLRRRMGTQAVEQETPATFLGKLQEAMSIDGAPSYCHITCVPPQPEHTEPGRWVCAQSIDRPCSSVQDLVANWLS